MKPAGWDDGLAEPVSTTDVLWIVGALGAMAAGVALIAVWGCRIVAGRA